MTHQRSLLAGGTDYTAVSLEDITTDFREWILQTEATVSELEVLAKRVREVSDRLDYPDEKIDYLVHFKHLFLRCSQELSRINCEIKNGPKEVHINAIMALYKLVKAEESICLDFKQRHINTSMKDNSLRFSLVDKIYGRVRSQILDYEDLSNAAVRLQLLVSNEIPLIPIKAIKQSDRSDHPAWRVFVLTIIIIAGFLGFWILPFKAALGLLVFILLIAPLVMAGVSHTAMKGSDYLAMYQAGVKAIPLLGRLFKSTSDKSAQKMP